MLPVWENQPDISGSSQGVVSHQEGNAIQAAKENWAHWDAYFSQKAALLE